MADSPKNAWEVTHLTSCRGATAPLRPVRRQPADGLGINAYTRGVGAELIEPTTNEPRLGRPERLPRRRGHGASPVRGRRLVRRPEFTFVSPPANREATAVCSSDTVVVVGGRPGSALRCPGRVLVRGEPAYQAGDFEEALASRAKALPNTPTTHT